MIKNAIVLVHHSHPELTLKCLNSLSRHCPQASIYVVDNSGETTPQSSNSNIHWLTTKNDGYGAGCNSGIEKAIEDGHQYILLLNNDTYIEKDICSTFFEYSQKHDHQHILTCQIRCPDQSIWYAGGSLSLYQMRAYHFHQNRSSGPVNFASGCALWLPQQVIKQLGLFDESYFLYLEDAELCLRAKSLNIQMHYISEATVFHEVSASTGGKNSSLSIFYQNRNRIKLLKQYGQFKHWLIFIPFYALGFCKRSFKFLLQRDGNKLKANWQALIQGLLA